MTAAVSLHLAPDAPLAQRLRQAEALRAAGEVAVRKAQLLEIAYYLSGPFPNVTELVITVASDDGRIEVETIHSAEILEWTNDDGVFSAPDGYRTLDGADLDTVVERVAALLETVLGEDKPAEVFEPMSRRNTYWVGLPAPDEVEQALRSAPTPPHPGYADITSLTDALAALRVWLDEGRPPVPAARRRDRSGATGAVTRLLAAVDAKLAELEDDAVDQQQRLVAVHDNVGRTPRLEIVVDRDPDGGTEVAGFLDGIRQKPEVTVVDPAARSRTRAEWRADARHHARLASPAAAALIRELFDSAEDGEFVIA